MLAKPPMFRKPCRKNQNSSQPDRTPAPPQPENTTLPFVHTRIINRLLEILWYSGLGLFLGGISGGIGNYAFRATPSSLYIYLTLSGIMVFVIRGTLLNLPLPSVDVRIKISEVMFCLGLVLFLGGGIIFPISGNAFVTRWVVVSGMMIILISYVLENAPLPSVYPRIMTVLIYLGYGLVIVGLAFILISGNPSAFVAQGMMLLGFIVFGISFVLWILPWLRKIWHFSIGKLILTWLHAVVLWLATVYARKLVAETLGLPPQDFDMTVAACALIFYFPVWLLLFSLLALITCVILMFYSSLISIPSSLVLVSMLFPEFVAKQQRRVFRSFTNALSALGAVFVIALVWEQLPAFTKRIEPVIRGEHSVILTSHR